MKNHHQQQEEQLQKEHEPMVPMSFHKNPNHEITHNHHYHHVLPSPSSRVLNTNHHQHNIHMSKEIITHEDEGFIFKNPNSFSCTSPVAGEEYMMPPPPLPQQDIKKLANHGINNILVSNKLTNEKCTIKNPNHEVIKKPNSPSCSSPLPGMAMVEESGRDRLKRHRVEMGGRVWIPDIWGHEDLLKDWIDCTVFDSSLGNNSIMSARAALIQEGRSTVRIENKC